jgi:MoaA/NifB/PqqE/SkfB family radical SAM enzyme
MTSKVGVDITTRCDFDCKHCFKCKFKENKDIDLKLLQKIISFAKEYKCRAISLTGGEPLLHQNIEKIFEIIIRNNLPLSFLSNGYRIKEKINLIKKYKQNIIGVLISLDGHNKEIHDRIRKDGSYDRAIEAMQILSKEGIPFSIITTIHKMNFGDEEEIIKKAIEIGATEISIGTVVPCSKVIKNNLFLSDAQKLNLYQNIMRLRNETGFTIRVAAELLASDDIVCCKTLTMTEFEFNINGELVFCPGLSRNDYINQKKIIVGKVSDKNLLVKYNQKLHDLIKSKIKDYNTYSSNAFNYYSCFYCVNRFRKI